MSKITAVIIICVLGVLVYSNTLHSPFQFDDASGLSSITDNLHIRDIGDPGAIWKIWPMRFVTFFTFALNYRFGRLDTFGYHLFNLAIHIGAALLLQWLVAMTFLTPALKEDRISRYSGPIAFFAGLIFISHPVQTNAVTYISQRAASMATFFYLASLCMYARSRLLKLDGKNHLFPYCAALLAAITAMFTKEISITLPLAVLLYETSFFKKDKSLDWRCIAPFLALLLVIPLTMVLARAVDFTHMCRAPEPSPGILPWHYLLTQTRVTVTYLRLMFIPINQTLDYDYRISNTFSEPSVLMSLGLLALILISAFKAFRRYRLASFGVLFFFLALIPESSIIPIKDVIFEYRLYLPTAGYSIFLAAGLFYLFQQRGVRYAALILLLAAAAYAIKAYHRNTVWKDELALWNDNVVKSPDKARPYNNRGFSYHKKGCFDRAISDYSRAIEINPRYSQAFYSRGFAYQEKGDIDRAILDYNRALAIDPDYADAYNNRGNAYKYKGDPGMALSDYNKALEIDPRLHMAYYNRGCLYKDSNDLSLAISNFDKALEIDPGYDNAYNNRGCVYKDKGDLDRAISDFNNAIACNPHNVCAYNNRGGVFQLKGDLEHAIADYDAALKIDPGYASAYSNRALAYFLKKDYDKAWKDMRKAEALGHKVDAALIMDLKKALESRG